MKESTILEKILPLPPEHFFINYPVFLIFCGVSSKFVVGVWTIIILWIALNLAWVILDVRERLEAKDKLWPIPIKVMVLALSLCPFFACMKK